MIEPIFLLSIAYMFAFINYYLGVFLLSLPVPHRQLKQFARLMVQDGTAYAILAPVAFSLPAAMHIAENFFSYDSQAAFIRLFNWLGFNEFGQPITQGIIEEITSVYSSIILQIMASSVLPIVGKAISQIQLSYADALTTVLSGSIMLLQFMYYFALFIWKFALPFLASVGALIYGLPARFGRQAGAFLIALSLTYYVGLPFMPYFVGIFYIPDRPRAVDIAQFADEFAGQVQSHNEKYSQFGTVRWQIQPIGGPSDYYCIRVGDDTVWWTDEDGGGEFPLPSGEHAYMITHFGDVGYLTGTLTVLSDQTTEMSLQYPAWNFEAVAGGSASIGDVHSPSAPIEEVYSHVIRIKCPLEQNTIYVDITVNNQTSLTWFHIDGDAVQASTVERERSRVYQVPIDLERYGNATRSVDFTVTSASPTQHFPKNKLASMESMVEEAYALHKEQSGVFGLMFGFSASLLLFTIVFPTTYLVTLFQISRRVARALGGRAMVVPEVG